MSIDVTDQVNKVSCLLYLKLLTKNDSIGGMRRQRLKLQWLFVIAHFQTISQDLSIQSVIFST